MQLALRPYLAAAGVAVVGAGLILITPVVAPRIAQRAIKLAGTENIFDLIGPDDMLVSGLGALSGEPSGALPSLDDLGGTFPEGASSLTGLELLDPEFWQEFWNALLEPNVGESPGLLLTGALEQLPVVGPLLAGLGVFVVLPVALLLGGLWSEISQALGLEPAAAAEVIATGLQGGYDAAITGVIDPALPADVSIALDPSAVTSILDVSLIADIGTLADASTIADLGGLLTSLIP